MEGLLAKASEMGNSPQQIFMAFNNADIDFGTIPDENGEDALLTNGRYTSFMESADRKVRKAAFERLYQVYGKNKNMLAATFEANLKQAKFFSAARHYGSTLEQALAGGNIPLSVYTELIRAVHEKLPAMHQYVKLRRKLLGVNELHMYDVYAPLVRGVEKNILLRKPKNLYGAGWRFWEKSMEAFWKKVSCNHWIDVYENQGKRSGAYSWAPTARILMCF